MKKNFGLFQYLTQKQTSLICGVVLSAVFGDFWADVKSEIKGQDFGEVFGEVRDILLLLLQ